MLRREAEHDRWSGRIARARHLAAQRPAAASMLRFYAELADFQRSLLERELALDWRRSSEALRHVAGLVPRLLRFLESAAPPRLRDAATRDELKRPDSDWLLLLERYWVAERHNIGDANDLEIFLAEALLQPFAERLAMEQKTTPSPGDSQVALCPTCTGKPVVGVLRENGQSARRSLICGLCLTEWTWPRVVCPACGERTFDAIGAYTADAYPATRLDVCDTCRTYVQTVDMTKDGHAIPIVDELAGIPLDLWAREQGYSKLRPNLLRL